MNKLLVIIFFLGCVTLLVAARFGFTWAGGAGYEKSMTASAEIISGDKTTSTNLVRGSVVETGGEEYAIIHIGQNIKIALDQRTTTSLEQLFPSGVKINLRGGRLLAKTSGETEQLTISSPETSDSITSGAVTAVRYDWLNKTEIIPLNEFDWQNSADKNFIVWAANRLSEPGFTASPEAQRRGMGF